MMPGDFNRRAEVNWIGKEVRLSYLYAGGPDIVGRLLAYDEGWLKVADGFNEFWISPAVPVVVCLEGKE